MQASSPAHLNPGSVKKQCECLSPLLIWALEYILVPLCNLLTLCQNPFHHSDVVAELVNLLLVFLYQKALRWC